MTHPTRLLTTRRFLPLFATQFFGALNDNIFKNALVMFILLKLQLEQGPMLIAMAAGVFILPYALFSATAGQLADEREKAALIRKTKIAEIVLMAAGALGFMLASLPLMIGVLFCMGAQSAFFGPLKYGILPDHLEQNELVAGNGLIEAGTFLAILIGTVTGAVLMTSDALGAGAVAWVVGSVAVAGFASSLFIPKAGPKDAAEPIRWNPVTESVRLVRTARQHRSVWLSILGISWFWAVGSILMTEIPVIALSIAGEDGNAVPLFLAVFAIGIGIGSMASSRILKDRISPWPVPLAGIAISIFAWDLSAALAASHTLATTEAILTSFAGIRILVDLAGVAFFGGVFSVPLYAIVQDRSPEAVRSRMIACNNILNAFFMVAAAGVLAALGALEFSPAQIIAVTAAVNLAVAIWIIAIVPQELLKAMFRWYFRTFHGARVKGLENLDKVGPRSVIVSNHLSFLDGCFVAAFLPGNPVFAIDTQQARRWAILKLFLNVFPVDPMNPMAIRSMTKAVREGNQLVIFPEGRITDNGAMKKIYEGAGDIADKADAELISIRLHGLQFHKTSRMDDKVETRWCPRFSMNVMEPVRIAVSPELKGKTRRRALRLQMQDLMMRSAIQSDVMDRSLIEALDGAREAYRNTPNGKPREIVLDAMDGKLTYDGLLKKAAMLGSILEKITAPGERVGVMLPNSAGVAVTFFALQSIGRVPAMLNFTAGAESLKSACHVSALKTVLTSSTFVEKAGLEGQVDALRDVVEVVLLEDMRAGLSLMDKIRAGVRAFRAVRSPKVLHGYSTDPNAPAVILFTSGSEGTPKGVALSHRNLLSNCAQVSAAVDLNPSDRIFNALPTFHSFGLTAATILPVMNGIQTFMYPSPMHYKVIPELVYDRRSTVLFATDSFLTGYARTASPEDFQHLRYIVAGAEKVKAETRAVYWEKFQKAIYEGYGATECSPVLAINTPSHFRSGTVGRLLPMIEHRFEPVPGVDADGRLFVRGPNVMLGYLKADNPGVIQPLEDGWHDMGDIVSMDADGFISIEGRAKRFAKIGGEMVSLTASETLASEVWPEDTSIVVSIPDPRKGEKLIVVTTRVDATTSDLMVRGREKGVAELTIPRELMFIDKMPLGGTGKVDYPAVQRLVESRAA